MTSSETTAVIVARFLKANHYNEVRKHLSVGRTPLIYSSQTFEAFIKEANLEDSAGDTKKGDWTIEKILEEKIQYDKSLNFEKNEGHGLQGWTDPAPSHPNESPDGGIIANILHASSSVSRDRIYISSADRRWTELSASPPYNVVTSVQPNDNPILSSAALPGHTALTTMSGQLLLLNNITGKVVSMRRDHTKYAVQVATTELSTSTWVLATASWDGTVKLYRIAIASDSEGTDPVYLDADIEIPTIKFQTNPESILFVRHPDTEDLYLIASRRDSTHLYYYKLTNFPNNHLSFEEAGRQNLAPHSNAWVSYTPSMLALHPSDPSLLAIATSHLPHMKLIVVRLLFPGPELAPLPGGTQASQARTALAMQDKEDAAIRLQVSTLAPQTPYSTPVVVWRPNGSGVWVNGDDGAVRGIEVRTGKVVAVLKGHEAGTKVRTLWAGEAGGDEEGGKREVLVSGGFDKRVFVWTVDPSGEASST